MDDLLLAGTEVVTNRLTSPFNARFNLRTIQHGPGKLRFVGLNVIQHPVMTVYIYADQNLNAAEQCPISRIRRREIAT